MMRARLLPSAREEVRAAAGWYESKREGLGVDFLAMLDEALSAIAEAPLTGAVLRVDRDYRRRRLRRSPYLVIDRVAKGTVTVVAVAHERRRPGYWTRR